jgi:tight adherence protein C
VIDRAGICAVVAGVLAARAIVDVAEGVRRAAPATDDGDHERVPSGYAANGLGAAAVRALARIGRRIGRPAAPSDLKSRLDAAGSPLGLTATDVMAVKAGATLVGFLLALGAVGALPGRLGLLMLVVAPAAGFVTPDLWLRRVAERRARAMALELSDVLDLLRVAVEGGLSVGRALTEVGHRHRGVLAAEMAGAADQMALGAPREEGLGRLVRRCPLEGVAALASAIDRCERHGAPLGPALNALAVEARSQRARARVEQAARAAPKIQLVVALLLVPSVLLLVAAALVRALVG